MKAVKDTREILGEGENVKVTVGEKLPLAYCKKILNRNSNNYTDEQVILIRDFLYTIATIDYLYFTEQYLKNETINQNQNYHEQESIPLHQSEYRRAG